MRVYLWCLFVLPPLYHRRQLHNHNARGIDIQLHAHQLHDKNCWGINCVIIPAPLASRAGGPKPIFRYRPKGVFGKGVGNSKNASVMRQKCVKNASKMRQNGSCFFWGKEERSKMRQNCVKNARNTFGGEHLLDDTDFLMSLKR